MANKRSLLGEKMHCRHGQLEQGWAIRKSALTFQGALVMARAAWSLEVLEGSLRVRYGKMLSLVSFLGHLSWGAAGQRVWLLSAMWLQNREEMAFETYY